MLTTAYIALGSNQGDRQSNINRAVEFIKTLNGIQLGKISSIYETEPEGGPSEFKYLNGVVEIKTTLLPDELLDRLNAIESRMGRIRNGKNSPRPIDLDILLYGDIVIDGERIKIPHPRMHTREFVLRGLVEIAPDIQHPRLKKTIRELYMDLKN